MGIDLLEVLDTKLNPAYIFYHLLGVSCKRFLCLFLLHGVIFIYLFILVVMVPRGKVGFELVFSFFLFCGPLKVIERPLV